MFLLIRQRTVWFSFWNNNLHSTMFLLIQEFLYTDFCKYWHLHPTMFLLIRHALFGWGIKHPHLHSTMFLLILVQSVSVYYKLCNLHSTMFLLILSTDHSAAPSYIVFTFHNVSINTVGQNVGQNVGMLFTFHNVSINTGFELFFVLFVLYLHSTMFLLIRSSTTPFNSAGGYIYIPQCFY